MATFMYNISPHSAIRYLPFELNYSHTAALLPVFYSLLRNKSIKPEKYLETLIWTLINIQTKAFITSFIQKEKHVEASICKNPHHFVSKINDQVLFQNNHS